MSRDAVLVQAIANGIVAAATYVLLGVGFALTYSLARFVNISHAAAYVVAPYCAFMLCSWFRLPLASGVAAGLIAAAAFGCVTERAVFGPLRRRMGSSLVLLLASLGVYVVMHNVVSMTYGDDAKRLSTRSVRGVLGVAGATLTYVQIAAVATAALSVAGLGLLLRRTRPGVAIRAIANDPWLACTCGVPSDRIVLLATGIGSCLGGAAGVLKALDVDMTPGMGLNALMMSVVAVIVGGISRPGGILLGALLLGVTRQLATLYLGAQWQDATAFIILLAFLIARPSGLSGKFGQGLRL